MCGLLGADNVEEETPDKIEGGDGDGQRGPASQGQRPRAGAPGAGARGGGVRRHSEFVNARGAFGVIADGELIRMDFTWGEERVVADQTPADPLPLSRTVISVI
jgi:hypothetical protein